MMSVARYACLAALVVAPLVTSSPLASNAVASAVCQQDDPQLALMQVQARQFLKVESHHYLIIPTLEQVQEAFDTFLQALQDIGHDVNSTLTTALTTGEGSMTKVSDFLQVAETSADTVRSMFGQSGQQIVDKLTTVSNKIQEQLNSFVSDSESFRLQMKDTLQGIYDSITGQANATIAKMETSNDDVEAASNTSSASLTQLKATLAELEKVVQSGCLSKADTRAILRTHGREPLVAHFQEVDSNGDGCIRKEELEQSAKQLDASFHRDGDTASLLMFRAAADHQLSSSSALEETVARKGASQDPCSVATSAIASANSSLLAFEDKLAGVNESVVELMEKGIQLLEASFQLVNGTVLAGLDAAIDAGLPGRMADPVKEALHSMMTGFDGLATTVRDSEASASDAMGNALKSLTPSCVDYIQGASSKLELVCA